VFVRRSDEKSRPEGIIDPFLRETVMSHNKIGYDDHNICSNGHQSFKPCLLHFQHDDRQQCLLRKQEKKFPLNFYNPGHSHVKADWSNDIKP
jgi:hypothetical protein